MPLGAQVMSRRCSGMQQDGRLHIPKPAALTSQCTESPRRSTKTAETRQRATEGQRTEQTPEKATHAATAPTNTETSKQHEARRSRCAAAFQRQAVRVHGGPAGAARGQLEPSVPLPPAANSPHPTAGRSAQACAVTMGSPGRGLSPSGLRVKHSGRQWASWAGRGHPRFGPRAGQGLHEALGATQALLSFLTNSLLLFRTVSVQRS